MHVEQYVKTRPADLVSKKGDGGTTVQLRANYFHVKKIPQWTLFQYRLNDTPPLQNNPGPLSKQFIFPELTFQSKKIERVFEEK